MEKKTLEDYWWINIRSSHVYFFIEKGFYYSVNRC